MDNLHQFASIYEIGTLCGIAIAALWVAPLIVSREICLWRNRNTTKATVITLLFGWLGTLGLWLVLKTRRADGTLV